MISFTPLNLYLGPSWAADTFMVPDLSDAMVSQAVQVQVREGWEWRHVPAQWIAGREPSGSGRTGIAVTAGLTALVETERRLLFRTIMQWSIAHDFWT